MLIAAALSGCGAAGSDNYSKHTYVKWSLNVFMSRDGIPETSSALVQNPDLIFYLMQ